jgi:cardiolipin synthase
MIDWLLVIETLYTIIILGVCLRIVYDTSETSKTLAYLLLTIFFPFGGAILYFVIGTNYRKRKLYSKKLFKDEQLMAAVKTQIFQDSHDTWEKVKPEFRKYKKLYKLLLNSNWSSISSSNRVQVLVNGEQKFPAVLKALRAAKNHIHIEYYIFEDEKIGNQIKDILIQKAKEGVQVRFIYDDFGSRSIRKDIVPELIAAGVKAFPFYKIFFMTLANRLNYRNHRKIIVIDGAIGFTGGINVSDRYINYKDQPDELFWRDTHVMISGPGVYYLQYLFICDWNFCSEHELAPDDDFFRCGQPSGDSGALVQIAASGPDSDDPTILFAFIKAIGLAERDILITTPYFIPGDTLLDALTVAALSGVKVKLLVPEKSDSKMVDFAARSYYGNLLRSGVEIYRYKKGFIHSKTMVSDGLLSVIGTANMDHRSFELNFEVNSVIYDEEIGRQLTEIFYDDLKSSEQIVRAEWETRPFLKELPEKLARLLSPLL